MTDITATVKTLLAADATLVALLTGGIFTKREIGDAGVDRNNSVTSSAYVSVGDYPVLQPCLVIVSRGFIPDGNRADAPSKTVSGRQIIELWFYSDQSIGFGTIESARDRCYALLQMESISGVGILTLVNNINDKYAPELDNVAMLRADYKSTRSKS